MLLGELVATSQTVAATRSRTAKVAALADCLRRLEDAERDAGIACLAGVLPQGRLGVGYAAIRAATAAPAAQPSLSVQETAACFAALAATGGPGSRTRRSEMLDRLLARATDNEQQFLCRLLVQELRQGALEGIMVDALAAAADVKAAAVRRAFMMSGSLVDVGGAALRGGSAGLREFRLTLFRPLLPMLAGTAPDAAAALHRTGIASVETKYDGARVQVHRCGSEVRVYTRNLREVSANLPELVVAVAALPVRSVILDGEVLALGPDGRPQPFQVTMSRFGRDNSRTGATSHQPRHGTAGREVADAASADSDADVEQVGGADAREASPDATRAASHAAAVRAGGAGTCGEATEDAQTATATTALEQAGRAAATRAAAATGAELPLQPYFFDCLHRDGEDLIDRPLGERLEALDRACPAALRVPRMVTDDPERACRHTTEVLAAGHEGVMVKALDSPYEAGRRGTGWIKVKPVHTLDLVVIAIEWGSGRRRGWLSNLHLAARDPEHGSFAMVGKTFKGMTDDMLRWQTNRFLELATHRSGGVVYVRPEQVVEIAFDGIQTSSRYESGMALRFARVKSYRADKPAGEADTVATMRALHQDGGPPRDEPPRV